MIGNDIDKAVSLLQSGKLVAIPTETVYGLAANAFDGIAVTQIFKAKNRPFFDPLIVHSHSLENIKEWVKEFPPQAEQLARAFWPGPLTLIFNKKEIIPDIVTAGNPTVAVRIPNHTLTIQLLSKLNFPLAAPSANPFGYVSPTTAQHVEDQLGDKIPYILNGGACKVGIESTIISFATGKPILLRLGGTSTEHIRDIVGDLAISINQNSNPQAPGQMDKHYSPRTKFLVGDLPEAPPFGVDLEKIGVITLSKTVEWVLSENQIQLSKKGDLGEAASNIFAAIRILDKKKLTKIYAEPMPDIGLGKAINDRLMRATHKL